MILKFINTIYTINWKKVAIGLAISLLLSLLLSQASFAQNDYQAKEGYLNLEKRNFEKEKIIALDGKWEFYPNQLLNSEDFQEVKNTQYFSYQQVPSHWNIYKVKGGEFGSTGFATYRLRVKIADTTQSYALRLLTLSNACKVFVNGELLTEIGKVGKTKTQSQPEYFPQVLRISNTKSELEIIFQVSNFHHNRGGIWKKVELGLEKELFLAQKIDTRLESFFWGTFIAMGVYFIGLFLRRQKDNYPSLFFGLCCLTLSIRMMGMGEVFSQPLGWQVVMHFEYGSFFLMPVFAAFMLWSLFPEDYYKPVLYGFLGIYGLINVIFIVTPVIFFTKLMPYVQLTLVLLLLYLIFGVIRAFRFKRESASLILMAFFFVFVAVVHDILFGSGVFISFQLLPWSLFAFCIIQAINLSYRFFTILDTNEKLSLELQDANHNLEQKVEARTQRLAEANEELRKSEQEVKLQNQELRQITEEITAQKELLEQQRNQSELLYKKLNDSIRAAKQIQEAILPIKTRMQELLPQHFVLYRPKDVVSGDFYWIEKIDQKILLVVIDCTGHGVPGAFMTLIAAEALDSIVLQQGVNDPADILNHLHYEVRTKLRQEETGSQEGMDASIILIEDIDKPDKVKVTFSGAKNGFYLVAPSEEPEVLRIRGHRTGIAGNQIMKTRFENQFFEFDKNSMIYIGTDGYEDQNNEKRKKFGRQRLQDLFLSIYQHSMTEQKEEMGNTLAQYMHKTNQRDDILWLGLKL